MRRQTKAASNNEPPKPPPCSDDLGLMVTLGTVCAYSFAKIPANFSLTFLTSSGLAWATAGKSFSRS
jgi:hypothetical protein